MRPLALAALAALVGAGCAAPAPTVEPPAEAAPVAEAPVEAVPVAPALPMAPAFAFADAADSTHVYGLDAFAGRFVLIDFWATWCGPCRAEIPNLGRAYASFHDRGLDVLSVSFDFARADIDGFRQRVDPMPWLHAWSRDGMDDPSSVAFGVQRLPDAVLIGPDGTVRARGGQLRRDLLHITLEEQIAAEAAVPVDPLDLIRDGFDALARWERQWGEAEPSPALDVPRERLADALEEYLGRMMAPPTGDAPGMYPFFHPRYAGQMLKPPHPVALAAYAIAARVNPNNHALDGGPPTSVMEKEVVADLAAMFGLASPTSQFKTPLGHLTGGGTVANLEALFIAREETGGKGIAVSAEGHYTHARMAGVLGIGCASVAADDAGRMDLDALEDTLRTGDVGTVVLTAGTTGLGAVDPLAEAIPLCRRHGARVHVDAAYGGFFRVLADAASPPAGFPAEHFRAIADADSVVVDPHKHGLQPYGCGAVLFADPSVGRHYRHDSPYTYFTSADLHLGEISLECSRPGAAAGALWLTLRALPLAPDDGLGPVLAAGLRAARQLHGHLEAAEHLAPVLAPETDIVVYAPLAASLEDLDARSAAVFQAGMDDPDDPVFVSLFRFGAERLRRRFSALAGDEPAARVLRSVLMKPEHEAWAGRLAARLDALAGALERGGTSDEE